MGATRIPHALRLAAPLKPQVPKSKLPFDKLRASGKECVLQKQPIEWLVPGREYHDLTAKPAAERSGFRASNFGFRISGRSDRGAWLHVVRHPVFRPRGRRHHVFLGWLRFLRCLRRWRRIGALDSGTGNGIGEGWQIIRSNLGGCLKS